MTPQETITDQVIHKTDYLRGRAVGLTRASLFENFSDCHAHMIGKITMASPPAGAYLEKVDPMMLVGGEPKSPKIGACASGAEWESFPSPAPVAGFTRR